MLIRCFIGAGLIGLCVGILAALGADSATDPFARLSLSAAYVVVLGAIAGGVLLALAIVASAGQIHHRRKRGQPH